MPDREKVIKDLEGYRDREFVKEGITVFDNDPRYRKLIIGNAIALLKNIPEIVRCKDCGFGEACKNGRGEHGVMCYNSHSANHGWVHEHDWFCADGERKDCTPLHQET